MIFHAPHPTKRRVLAAAISKAPGAIRERMLEDIDHLVHDGGEEAVITQSDLVGLGWPTATVLTHGTAAFSSYRAAQEQGARGRFFAELDTTARIAAEASALLLFLSGLSVWTGLAAGAL